jgi:hypothetical protein
LFGKSLKSQKKKKRKLSEGEEKIKFQKEQRSRKTIWEIARNYEIMVYF